MDEPNNLNDLFKYFAENNKTFQIELREPDQLTRPGKVIAIGQDYVCFGMRVKDKIVKCYYPKQRLVGFVVSEGGVLVDPSTDK